jgi:hypothetical protein
VLSLAAREADIVSLNFDNSSGALGGQAVQSGSAEATAEKVRWVKSAAGARMERIELEIGAYFTFVTENPEPIAAGMGRALGLSAQEMLRHPHALFGSSEVICDELERRRAAYGISYVTVGDNALEAFAPVVSRLSGK